MNCPVCSAADWRPLRTYLYSPADTGLNAYEALRRRVLFEVWHPGEERLTLTARVCADCGFVAYAPRPSENDIEAKYRFLQQHEGDIGGESTTTLGRELDDRRAERTYRAVGLRRPSRVLDFGGGDGKLLAPFERKGHDCFLVDYNTHPRRGVTKLGDTLDGIEERFEAIICSHVLEHVANPVNTMRALRERLTPGGRVYVEVPSEVWKGIPISRDPVTHVNFFTVTSLNRLLAVTGFIGSARERGGSYGASRKPVIVVVARAADGLDETERRVNPDLPGRLRRAWYAGRPHRLRRRLSTLTRSGAD